MFSWRAGRKLCAWLPNATLGRRKGARQPVSKLLFPLITSLNVSCLLSRRQAASVLVSEETAEGGFGRAGTGSPASRAAQPNFIQDAFEI